MIILTTIGAIILICYGGLIGLTCNHRFTAQRLSEYTEKSAALLHRTLGAGMSMIGLGVMFIGLGCHNHQWFDAYLMICSGIAMIWITAAICITVFLIVPEKKKRIKTA